MIRGPDARPSPAPPTVLVVDDDAETRRLVARWLARANLSCLDADSGLRALETMRRDPAGIDLVILDVMMPGMNGFEVLAAMHADEKLRPIPVIVLTAHADDDASIVEGARLGAIDHLTKPFSGPVLVAKVQRAVEARLEEKALREKLAEAEKRARIDPLTQLGNRALLFERLREEAAFARRHQSPLCLAVLDLDHFKNINDTLGHEAGDAALRHFAKLLAASMRQGDAAFRYGGEEFVVLLRSSNVTAALSAMQRLRTSLSLSPAPISDPSLAFLRFSSGISVADAHNGFAADNLLARADEALYRAKESGRARDEIAIAPD